MFAYNTEYALWINYSVYQGELQCCYVYIVVVTFDYVEKWPVKRHRYSESSFITRFLKDRQNRLWSPIPDEGEA